MTASMMATNITVYPTSRNHGTTCLAEPKGQQTAAPIRPFLAVPCFRPLVSVHPLLLDNSNNSDNTETPCCHNNCLYNMCPWKSTHLGRVHKVQQCSAQYSELVLFTACMHRNVHLAAQACRSAYTSVHRLRHPVMQIFPVAYACGTHICTDTYTHRQRYRHACIHSRTLSAVVVRIERRFWADRILMRRRMSSSKVRPCRVVNRVSWSDMLSVWLYMAAIPYRPELASGSAHLPSPPGI